MHPFVCSIIGTFVMRKQQELGLQCQAQLELQVLAKVNNWYKLVICTDFSRFLLSSGYELNIEVFLPVGLSSKNYKKNKNN